MRELSLNILDIAENSLTAEATLVQIDVTVQDNLLTIAIEDNGCGMDREFLERVCDPYSTTRTTRKVGLGIPLLKMQAELCNGSFEIHSQVGVGTKLIATFQLDHIDRPPLGDVGASIVTLLPDIGNTQLILRYSAKGQTFIFDTNELLEQLDGLPLDTPEVLVFVKQLIQENIKDINGGIQI